MVLFKKKLQKEIEKEMVKEGVILLDDSEKYYNDLCNYIEKLNELDQVVFINLYISKIIAGFDDKYIKEIVKFLCKMDFNKLKKKLENNPDEINE